jgi:predicted MFS family arabinose efflux permease
MFTILHPILVFVLVQWLSTQEWAGPLIYWLVGYYVASVLVAGLVVLVVWLSRRKPRDAKRSPAGSVTKEACGASAAIGG